MLFNCSVYFTEESLNKLKNYSRLLKVIMLRSLHLVPNSLTLLDMQTCEDVSHHSPSGSPQTQGENEDQLCKHQVRIILLLQWAATVSE